jgi:biopolymer transport protein TolR
MNRILVMCLFALTLGVSFTPLVGMQPSAATQSSSFAGTWKGTMNNVPGIYLTIQESASKISGSIVFYFQERADVNSPWRATAEHAVPLLKPHLDGRALTFEVEHHVCHGCQELGPTVTFRMELAGANEARLARFEEDGTEGAQVKLIRQNDAPGQAAPPLQEGISVDMPVTSNATPMPDADQEDALIVTVTDDGKVYVGLTLMDLDGLAGGVQASLSQRPGKRIYIKADGRAPYGTVMKVLDAATAAGMERTVLLTSEHESPQPGTVVQPKGFTIMNMGCLATARPRLSL